VGFSVPTDTVLEDNLDMPSRLDDLKLAVTGKSMLVRMFRARQYVKKAKKALRNIEVSFITNWSEKLSDIRS
jgi:hypothetical protein